MQPVLVLGSAPRVVVTVARSLHRRGVPVIVAALSPQYPRMISRAIQRFVHLPDHREAPHECLAALMKLICTERCDMLMPTDDMALAVVTENYESLKAMLEITCPPPQIVKRVLEKDLTLEVARQCGIPVPATYPISDAIELEALRSTIRFPMIAKPRAKRNIDTHGFKIRYFQTFQELAAGFRSDPQFGTNNLLQEYFSGDGVGVEVLMHEGQPVTMLQHRRLKELPSTGGVSVLAISEALHPMLTQYAVALLRALEWEGVAMVEFRREPITQRAVLMEVNGRYWGSLSLANHAGVDFPLYEWQLAHGESPIVPSGYPVGMRWHWMTGDLKRLHGLLVDPPPAGFPRPALLKEIVQFMLDCRPSTRLCLWSFQDPKPALCEFGGTLSEFGQTLKSLVWAGAKPIIKRMIPRRLLDYKRIYQALGPCAGSVYLKLRLRRAFLRDRNRKIPSEVRSILFVCHGNIIRSPMAAALLKRCLPDGYRHISVTSAGLYAKPPRGADSRAKHVAKEFGISLEAHRAQLVTTELVEQSDVIFVMDYRNEAGLLDRYPEAAHKVFLLGAYAGMMGLSAGEIEDPDQGDTEEIRRCYEILSVCTHHFTEVLMFGSAPYRQSVVRSQ
jgi:protein-tyrosine-phosphatase/predicted ATP-grasp superfamily ATP-dependent carboligase